MSIIVLKLIRIASFPAMTMRTVRHCKERGEPEQIGISSGRLRRTILHAPFIRNRFTVLNLAVRTGKMSEWLDALFGLDGIFYFQLNKQA
ncbi:MAG: hypothetical protein LBE91_04300 [Tannerella sp.]|jgi:hypothetical protein|nr:hypothetical protein [Tannerella sp.]